jgi:hypothetical protein
MTLGVIDSRL